MYSDLEQIRKAIINAGSDNEGFFGFPVKEDGIHLQQDPDEYAEFVHFVASNLPPSSLAIDIGIASGGQTKFLRDYYSIERTIILDIGQHPKFQHWPRIKKNVKSTIELELIMDSHCKEARTALLHYKGQVDFAFIDGDHSYKGLKRDIDLVKFLAKPDAIFILHDTISVHDCALVSKELSADKDFELIRNIDKKFGISIWRYLAQRPLRSEFLWKNFGWFI